jgi:excinuclease ABC subunit A
MFEFSTPESLLEIDFSQPLFALVDRIVMGPDLRQRLVDSLEICYRQSGEAVFQQAGAETPRSLRFNEKFSCKRCNREFIDPEPGLFSFNSPAGACPRCQGFGNTIDYDLDRVVPDRFLSLEDGALTPPLAWRNLAQGNNSRHSEMVVESSDSGLFLKRNLALRVPKPAWLRNRSSAV